MQHSARRRVNVSAGTPGAHGLPPAGSTALFRRSEVVELMIAAGLFFAALVVIGVLISVFSVVGWFLWLPSLYR